MICWHVPYQRCKHRHARLLFYGRCRSGQRWFWVAKQFDGPHAQGWTTREDQALAAARAAVERLADGVDAAAMISHGSASYALKQLNDDKRRAKPASKAKGSRAVEYFYGWDERFRIVKRTKQRIYYLKAGEPIDAQGEPVGSMPKFLREDSSVGFLTPADLAGRYAGLYFATREQWLEACRQRDSGSIKPPDLAALKAAMAAAHPDKGGSNAAFIAARARYTAARRAAKQESRNA